MNLNEYFIQGINAGLTLITYNIWMKTDGSESLMFLNGDGSKYLSKHYQLHRSLGKKFSFFTPLGIQNNGKVGTPFFIRYMHYIYKYPLQEDTFNIFKNLVLSIGW